jgi:hypothetical protein
LISKMIVVDVKERISIEAVLDLPLFQDSPIALPGVGVPTRGLPIVSRKAPDLEGRVVSGAGRDRGEKAVRR